MATELYRAVVPASFSLLGLWWLVLQFRHETLLGDADSRAAAYGMSLNFALPGVMSVMALAAPEHSAVWRISFGSAGAIGAIVTVRRLAAARRGRGGAPEAIAVAALTVAYVVVTLLAVDSGLLRNVGIGLLPLEAEGILVGLLLLGGLNVAWLSLSNPRPSS